MNVYWILPEDDSAEAAVEATRRQVAEGDHGDPALAEALRTIRSDAEIVHGGIVPNRRPLLGPAINAYRRGVTRLFWWYGLPRWGQVAEYHRSVATTIEILLAQQGRLRARVAALEARLAALEKTPPGP